MPNFDIYGKPIEDCKDFNMNDTSLPINEDSKDDFNLLPDNNREEPDDVPYGEKDKSGNYQINKAYLNPFLDMFNSEIISYSINKRPNYKAVEEALDKAIEITKDQKEVIYHSDQGRLYQIPRYVNTLKENGITQSMSRKGNCLDNSIMENFFSLLKQEMYNKKVFYSFEELEQAIIEYIYYYNHKRIKEKLNFMSPVEYRLNNEKNKKGAKFNKSSFSIEKGSTNKNHANSYVCR